MEKYKELLKKIIQLRYFDSCVIHNITDVRFESNGVRVDYSYLFLEDERAIRGEVIYNSELNAYMFDNFTS